MRRLLWLPTLALMGCSDHRKHVKAYPDTLVPGSVSWVSGGKLTIAGKPAEVLFESVDNRMIDAGRQVFQHEGFWNIEVLPGRRAIHFTFEYDGKLTPTDVVLHLKPGIEYTFAPKFVDGKLLQAWQERPITRAP